MSISKWPEQRAKEDFERILDPQGEVCGDMPDIGSEALLHWHEAMVKTRMFEDMALRLQRRGVFSVVAGGPGEEAIGVGASAALQENDWLHPTYRQAGALMYWGFPIDRTFAAMLGHAPEHVRAALPLDPADLPKLRSTPFPVFLGANIPLAAGAALADKLNHRAQVSLAFIGDGATSEGDFHDGLGLAGALKVPLVVVIANNGWSISVPTSRQTAAETLAQKAVAHGIPHRRVDGNDVFAVYLATKAALDAARRGEGPCLIEAVTYRMRAHTSNDDAQTYRDDAELHYWAKRDPIGRFEKYIERRGLVDEAYRTAQRKRIEAELRAAVKRAQSVPPTPPDTMFLNRLTGDEGWQFRHQQAELEAELEGRNPFLDFDGGGLPEARS
ncbi:MAG: 2-oxo acid dehydrogenase [Nevskiaceae bacterium]|nr:MAG: 2-oxo acid dehydrogenase [Nevskiaceae bacterium]TBR71408.1 MAG: 2-oxo acid dehydrogenase [Nevskiaceae bacterium]